MKREIIGRILFIAFACVLTLTGCGGDMAPENAETIKVEVSKGTGKVGGLIRASSPGTAGISNKSFDFDIPGSFELKGGPSEYTVQFNSTNKEMRKSIVISVDGRVLERGKDMVWEDDKGPRITFTTQGKK